MSRQYLPVAGEPPDPRAIAEAAKHEVDISGLRARQLTGADFHNFDFMLMMDEANLRASGSFGPQGAAIRPRLLMDLVLGREGAEVSDPWYGGEDDFRDTWADVSAAAAALVSRFARNSQPRG